MATAYDRIAFLNEYLQHSDRYLPMIDHAWQIFPQRSEYGEVNIGWDAGLIAEKRPYFCECWAEGYTVLTYFISTKGIEDYTPEQLENLLRESGIIWYKEPGIRHPDVQIFSDNSGQVFFSVNYLVGDDDGTYTEGGIIFAFSILNDFNKTRKKK